MDFNRKKEKKEITIYYSFLLLFMELSYNEKKVLLALKQGILTPEQIMQKGFEQLVEVMNAVSWLQSKGLVSISESLTTYYSLNEEGKEFLEKKLPERRVLDLLKKDGKISIDRISEVLNKSELLIALGWLKKKNLAEIKKEGQKIIIEISKNGINAIIGKTADEILLEKLGNSIIFEKDGNVFEKFENQIIGIDKKNLEMLKSRQIIKEKDVISREVSLTEEGKKILDKGIELKEEISQLTPNLILFGKWKEVNLKKYDINTFSPTIYCGKEHPFQTMIKEIREIFISLGFKEIEYDYVQSSFWNMDALFVPQDHPAREMQDTFFLSNPEKLALPKKFTKRIKEVHENGWKTGSIGWQSKWSKEESSKALLRTHTTVNSIRYLAENNKPPVKVFTIGRNFRREAIDYKHLPEFTQIEGIVMEKNANFSMLIGILKEFYKRIGFEKIRIKPSYFPFTEPSLEVVIEFNGNPMEFGGAGIFRKEVVLPFGIKHRVLAWGLGLERLAMMKFGLKDIRELYISDIEWLRK